MEEFFSIVLILVLCLIYILPAIIAGRRKHHNAGAIAVCNILLGWTFIGWALSLVWAFTAVQPQPQK